MLPGMVYMEDSNPLVFAFGSFLLLQCDYFLFMTATSNPGFLPKQVPPFATSSIGSPTISQIIKNNPEAAEILARPFTLMPGNNSLLRLKYCRTCNIIKPSRSSHCADCNVCIEKFDHHCPWIGNCIGKLNYKYFIGFLWSIGLLIVYIIATCIILIYDNGIEDSPCEMFLVCFCGIVSNN